MGDHFICNGLVHHIAERYKTIHLPAKKNYFATIKHLYEDFDNVKVFPIVSEPTDINNKGLAILRIGFERCDPMRFERSFYEQENIPYEYRFSKFKLPSNLEKSKQFYDSVVRRLGKEYIFVHDTSSVKKFDLEIESDLPQHVVSVEDTPDVIDYTDAICNAKEVHFINSSIQALVLNLNYMGMVKADKVVYHNARPIRMGGVPIEVPAGVTEKKYEEYIIV